MIIEIEDVRRNPRLGERILIFTPSKIEVVEVTKGVFVDGECVIVKRTFRSESESKLVRTLVETLMQRQAREKKLAEQREQERKLEREQQEQKQLEEDYTDGIAFPYQWMDKEDEETNKTTTNQQTNQRAD